MNLFSALTERWGPLPAIVWIAVASGALYWWASRQNRSVGPAMPIWSGGLGTGQGTPLPPEDCPYNQYTANRVLGLLPPPGLPSPLCPWVSLIGGINPVLAPPPYAMADAEVA